MADLIQIHEHSLSVPQCDKANVPYTASRLWSGLVDFARHPEMYIEAMEKATIREVETNENRVKLERDIDFGNFHFTDSVTLFSGRQFVNAVPTMGNYPASIFSIRIVEDKALSLTFTYREVFMRGVSDSNEVCSIRRQAWENKDKEVLAKILARI